MEAAEAADERVSVVLVDDVADLRALVRVALELSARFDVVAEGENGEEAIELARTHRPDLVVLDISMPVRDGLDALPDVLAASPSSRVVILSALDRNGHAAAALEGGASAFVEKGTDPDELVRRLLAVARG